MSNASAGSPERISLVNLGLLAMLTLGWGINWPIMKIALLEWHPWTFRALCTMCGAAGLLAIARVSGMRIRLLEGEFKRLFVISLANITGWNVLVVYALSELPAGRGVMLAFTMPLWLAIISHFALGQRINARSALGLVLGMAGIATLIGGNFAEMIKAPLGIIFMLGGAISWAFGVALTKKYPLSLSPVAFTGWQMLIGGVPVVIGAVLLDPLPLGPYGFGPLMALIYNGLICFIFCYWIWNHIVGELPVAVSGISTLMIPIVGLVSGALMLGERPGFSDFIAMALILMALSTILLPKKAT